MILAEAMLLLCVVIGNECVKVSGAVQGMVFFVPCEARMLLPTQTAEILNAEK